MRINERAVSIPSFISKGSAHNLSLQKDYDKTVRQASPQ